MMDRQIKPGDVILSFNGRTILDPRDLPARTQINQYRHDHAENQLEDFHLVGIYDLEHDHSADPLGES